MDANYWLYTQALTHAEGLFIAMLGVTLRDQFEMRKFIEEPSGNGQANNSSTDNCWEKRFSSGNHEPDHRKVRLSKDRRHLIGRRKSVDEVSLRLFIIT